MKDWDYLNCDYPVNHWKKQKLLRSPLCTGILFHGDINRKRVENFEAW